ncbi:MAG: hypothetical protein NXI32_14455 [bacterium]|nr:hypothetical protein [bacterium]
MNTETSTSPPSDYTLGWDTGTSKSKVIIHVERDGEILHHDECNVHNKKSRDKLIAELADLGCDEETVTAELLAIASEARPQAKPKQESAARQADDPLSQMPDSVVRDANEILRECPNLLEQAYRDAQQVGIVGEELTVMTLYLSGVSRLLSKPLSVIVQGSSSSGKSYVVERVAELFPPEAKIVVQQMTPQALFYLPDGALEHKLIIAGERSRIEDDSTAEATRALREMLSSGVLRKMIPVKGADGRMTTEVIESRGPIAYIESTTLGTIFDEDLNRCVLIHTDESEAQTRRILQAEAVRASRDNSDAIYRQYAIQRLLKPYTVLIPFAEDLARLLPAERVECRRAFSHIKSCISASALLHQQQRTMTDGCIVACENDYAATYTLLSKPMTESVGSGVSVVAKEYWEWIASKYGRDKPFCVQDLLNFEDCPKGRERSYSIVQELGNQNCLRVVDMQGSKKKYHKLARHPDDAASPLPEPEILFS